MRREITGIFNAVYEIPNRKMKQSVKHEEGLWFSFFRSSNFAYRKSGMFKLPIVCRDREKRSANTGSSDVVRTRAYI